MRLLLLILLTPLYALSLHYAGFSGTGIKVATLENGDETEIFLNRVQNLGKRGKVSKATVVQLEYEEKAKYRARVQHAIGYVGQKLKQHDFWMAVVGM